VNGSAACTACSAGTYNDRLAATTCLSCPSASHSLLGGSDEEADCTCNAGYTGAAGGPCTECAAGKYKATWGGGCQNCPPNSNSGIGASACLCNAGFGGLTAATCVACEIGKSKELSGNTACLPCVNVARTCGSAQNVQCPATLSSTMFPYIASLGNDGILGNFVHSSESTLVVPIVFMIDFQKTQFIQYITFYNRNDACCKSRINGAQIRIGSTSAWATSTVCATLNSDMVQTRECNLSGQYIFVGLPVGSPSTTLNFAELQAYSACSLPHT